MKSMLTVFTTIIIYMFCIRHWVSFPITLGSMVWHFVRFEIRHKAWLGTFRISSSMQFRIKCLPPDPTPWLEKPGKQALGSRGSVDW